MSGRLLVVGVLAFGAVAMAGGVILWRGVYDRGPRLRDVSWLTEHARWQELDDASRARLRSAADDVELHPRRGLAWGTLAAHVDLHGMTQESLTLYQRAEELRPDDARWPSLLASALARLERFQDAIVCLRRAVVLAPDDVRLRLRLGGVFERLEDPARASHHYEHALLLDAQSVRARQALGRISLAQGDVVSARAHLQRAVDAAPDVGESHSLLSQALQALGEAATARHEAELAEKSKQAALPPEDPVREFVLKSRTGRESD